MRPKRISFVSAILVLVAAGAAAILLTACTRKVDSFETVRIGAGTAVSGLIYIAGDKGFFKRRGISVAIKDYDTGALAMDGLLADAVDAAAAAEFVMAQKGFDHRELRTFGQIANAQTIGIIARKDLGIEKPSDLKGKRIGLPRGSNAQYFFDRFLELEGIPISGVQMVDLAPKPAEEALISGSIDAVMTWEPNVIRMKQRFGKNAVGWPIQGRDDHYFLAITTETFLRRSPVAVEKMLRALIDAEDFVGKHPEESARIIDRCTKSRSGDAQLQLARSTLKVGLDQKLIAAMEAEAHWMIRNNLTTTKKMPNYLDMIYLKALEAVRPDAVGIIH
jgi:NitT/TauT family transport system substrate-binding protein